MKKAIRFLLKTVAILFIIVNSIIAFHAYKFTHFYDVGEVTIKQQKDKTKWDITKEMLLGIT